MGNNNVQWQMHWKQNGAKKTTFIIIQPNLHCKFKKKKNENEIGLKQKQAYKKKNNHNDVLIFVQWTNGKSFSNESGECFGGRSDAFLHVENSFWTKRHVRGWSKNVDDKEKFASWIPGASRKIDNELI